jgi:hypothetical protein
MQLMNDDDMVPTLRTRAVPARRVPVWADPGGPDDLYKPAAGLRHQSPTSRESIGCIVATMAAGSASGGRSLVRQSKDFGARALNVHLPAKTTRCRLYDDRFLRTAELDQGCKSQRV